MNNREITGIRNVKFYDLNGDMVAELDKITDITINFEAHSSEIPSADVNISCNNINFITKSESSAEVINNEEPEDYFKEVYKGWF